MSLYTETITITPEVSVFTPPSDCRTKWTYEDSYYNSVSGGLLMQNLIPDQLDTTCFPDGFGAYGRAPSSIQVYSPYVCPSGYTTPGLFNDAGTTTAICCQSGFSYYSLYSSINYNGPSSVLFLGCISTFDGTTTVPGRSNDSDLESTVVEGPLTMWGQPVTVEYQQADLTLFPATTTTSSGSTSTATRSATASSTSPASTGTTDSSAGLSSGAKAGIGIGIAGAAVGLVSIAAFFILRKRRRRLAPGAASMEPLSNKPPVFQQKYDQSYGPQEIDGQETAMLPYHSPQPHPQYGELDGGYPFGAGQKPGARPANQHFISELE